MLETISELNGCFMILLRSTNKSFIPVSFFRQSPFMAIDPGVKSGVTLIRLMVGCILSRYYLRCQLINIVRITLERHGNQAKKCKKLILEKNNLIIMPCLKIFAKRANGSLEKNNFNRIVPGVQQSYHG